MDPIIYAMVARLRVMAHTILVTSEHTAYQILPGLLTLSVIQTHLVIQIPMATQTHLMIQTQP
eukprot:gene20593-24685_t